MSVGFIMYKNCIIILLPQLIYVSSKKPKSTHTQVNMEEGRAAERGRGSWRLRGPSSMAVRGSAIPMCVSKIIVCTVYFIYIILLLYKSGLLSTEIF